MYSDDNEKDGFTETVGKSVKGNFSKCGKYFGEKLDNNCETNYQLFAVMLIGGLFLFGLSLFFLPMVLISPSKFSMCLCLGSLFIVFSFFFVKKPSDYIGSLCSGSRMWVTLAYFGSVGLTIFACIIVKSYLLAFPSSIVQFITSLWIICSFFPGGSTGMSLFTKCIGNCCKGLIGRMLN